MYAYDKTEIDCPNFHQFIEDLCDGHEDRKKCIQVMLHCLLRSRTSFQVFFYLYGPGASGKSTLVSLATFLVGEKSVHSTTLTALNQV